MNAARRHDKSSDETMLLLRRRKRDWSRGMSAGKINFRVTSLKRNGDARLIPIHQRRAKSAGK